VADPAIVDTAADAPSHRSGAQLLAIGVLLGAIVAWIALYASAFGSDVHPVGPDMFAYIWQTRLAETGSLAQLGPRPGMPLLGSVMSGFHAVTAADAPLVLGIVLAVTLGLAVAVGLRLAFRLPPWSLGVATFTIASWEGVVSLSRGYLANELSLVCAVLATLLVALPGGHARMRMLGGFAAMTAAGVAHPGFLPFYVLVYVVWLLLALPRMIGGRDRRRGWREIASVRALVVLAGAAGVTSIVILGLMEFRVSDITNLTNEGVDFSQKLSPMWRKIGLWQAVSVLAVVGVVAGWRLRGPSSEDVIRAGSAWALCSVAGGLATLANPSLPGPRALLVILPLPAAAALGIVAIVRTLSHVGQRPIGTRGESNAVLALSGVVVAGAVLVVSSALVAAPGLERLGTLGREPVRGGPARLVASYVATVAPNGAVVVFTSPSTEKGARSWRGKQSQVRAYVPTPDIASTFVVVGVLGGEDGATPRPAGGDGSTGSGGLAFASEQSWTGAGSAIRNGAIVVAPRTFNDRVWKLLSRDPTRIVAPGLAVLRGPATVPRVPIAPVAVPGDEFIVRALACFLILAALGGGYAGAGARALNATRLDAIALAPAFGVVLIVLTRLAVGLLAGNRPGAVGLAAAVGVAVIGYALAWRAAERVQRIPEGRSVNGARSG
jgi:hypothetical protein